MPKIRSSADLRNHYNEISTFCHDYAEPVFITKNGKGDLAVMSIETYEALTSRFELYVKLQEGLDDVAAGRTRPWKDVTAEQDINESVRYVTLQLKNPIAGQRLLGNTIDCVDSLESFPARFPVIDDPILVIHQIHFVPVQNYLLFYQIHEPSHTVMVLRFLYGKSDWASILKNDLLCS